MRIRKARADDMARLEACARAAYEVYVERIGKAPAPMCADFARHVAEGVAYVAEGAGEILGYAIFYPRGDHVHLENVAVFPEHQGKGTGGALIAFVEDEARRLGQVAVELYTNVKMFENLVMYPALGYVETERRTEQGFERVFFRKELRDGAAPRTRSSA